MIHKLGKKRGKNMTITNQRGKELSRKEIYKMTKDAGLLMMKNVEDNTLLSIEAFISYEDGESLIHSIMTTDGECYAFQSQTFANSLNDIYDIMGEDEPVDIIKISGRTKAGRDFINCKLA